MDPRPCDDILSQSVSPLEALSSSQVNEPSPHPNSEASPGQVSHAVDEVTRSSSPNPTAGECPPVNLNEASVPAKPLVSSLAPPTPTTACPSKENLMEPQQCEKPVTAEAPKSIEVPSPEAQSQEQSSPLPKSEKVFPESHDEKVEEPSTERTEKEEEDAKTGLHDSNGAGMTDIVSGPFVVRQYETLESAEAAIERPALSDGDSPTNNAVGDASTRRRHTGAGGRSSMPRHPSKRTRSSTSSAQVGRDDDDTEMSDGVSQQRPPPKKRARVTESARTSVSSLPATELSLDDLPSGWTEPLLFFATMTKKQSWKQWKALPERRVCNGAIWLSPTCTGTPGASDHVDGPTAILRDLVSILQTPSNTIKLHENNYTSLARANVRASVGTNKITTDFGVTRVIKAFTEKEYIQRIPLDIVCSMFVQQLRFMLSRCKRFPSHLFASEVHLYQYAPTVAFHLRANEVPISLASLLTAFGDDSTVASMQALKEDYRKHIGTRSVGSRRRGEGLTSATASFFMTNDTISQINNILDTVQKRLDAIKNIKYGPGLPSETPVKGKAYKKGDYVVKDLPVRLLPRSAAALRDRTYDFFDTPSYIIYADLTHVEEEDKPAYSQAVALHVKEDSHWLDSITAQYIDLTLPEEVETWLVGKERWHSLTAVPTPQSDDEAARSVVHHLISHTSSVAPNANIVISLKVTPAEEKSDKLQARNKAYISIRANRDIGEEEAVVLDPIHRKVTWAELADDDTAPEVTQE